ncbi:hypothetical protein ES703_94407 [subsurface metagenome]
MPDINAVLRTCHRIWEMQPVEVAKELGYVTVKDLYLSGIRPWDAWLTIREAVKARRGPPNSESTNVEEL